ncbi:hypothetical protein MAPG_08694 [Magnaporthiopsis poae ATCC 64411]|uniref:Uncharacterized protein n=1 Tax=Magnaporthiopsis poae (strain ATCC 64411 / 73-15) TaxID=644358 RepID=A0A0C4E808_MAGP6|nr:hypothetical protein MAPG_08694 [Magnaporthiopsis poae ATCC 64411]
MVKHKYKIYGVKIRFYQKENCLFYIFISKAPFFGPFFLWLFNFKRLKIFSVNLKVNKKLLKKRRPITFFAYKSTLYVTPGY